MQSICDLLPHEAARTLCDMFVRNLRSYPQPYSSKISISVRYLEHLIATGGQPSGWPSEAVSLQKWLASVAVVEHWSKHSLETYLGREKTNIVENTNNNIWTSPL